MSPSRKKAAKTTAKKAGAKAKKAAAKKKAAPKKKAAAKKKATSSKKAGKKASGSAKKSAKKAAKKPPAAKKSSAKTATKKSAAKAAAKTNAKAKGKAASKKAAAKPAKKADSPKAAPKKATGAKSKKGSAKAADVRSGKRVRAKKPATPTGPRHPKFGFKWICFECDQKFYDLGKEDPICPKCDANQNERPVADAKPVPEPKKKAKVVRPMAQLLDDEEPVTRHEDEDGGSATASPAQAKMFDETEADEAGLDIDDADAADSAGEPPEIDAL